MEYASGTDDLFADSSTETVKENKSSKDICLGINTNCLQNESNHGCNLIEENLIQSPESMVNGSVIAIRVIEDYCKPCQIVYCPFCPMSYTTEHLLKSHLKDMHTPHLNLIFNDENPFITLQSCTLCHAKFYTMGLLPLHLLKVHKNALIGLINCRNAKCDDFLYCMFCRFTVLKNNSMALMLHLEKMHFPEFENFILNNYSVRVNAKEVLSSLQEKKKYVHFSSSLNRASRRVTFSSHSMNNSARRKLDFNDIEVKRVHKIQFRFPKREKSHRENMSTISILKTKEKKKHSRWFHFRKTHKKTNPISKVITSTPKEKNISLDDSSLSNEPTFEFMQFRCASCHQTFRNNTNLLNHVSHCHKWPWNRLRPCYSCGFCDATFYRNSFLVRHTINHHTPKCLRSDMED